MRAPRGNKGLSLSASGLAISALAADEPRMTCATSDKRAWDGMPFMPTRTQYLNAPADPMIRRLHHRQHRANGAPSGVGVPRTTSRSSWLVKQTMKSSDLVRRTETLSSSMPKCCRRCMWTRAGVTAGLVPTTMAKSVRDKASSVACSARVRGTMTSSRRSVLALVLGDASGASTRLSRECG